MNTIILLPQHHRYSEQGTWHMRNIDQVIQKKTCFHMNVTVFLAIALDELAAQCTCWWPVTMDETCNCELVYHFCYKLFHVVFHNRMITFST